MIDQHEQGGDWGLNQGLYNYSGALGGCGSSVCAEMDAALVDLVPPGGGETAGAAEEDDFTIEDTGGNEDDDRFDMIVGLLEDIMMDDGFRTLQDQFCNRHCGVFENTDENKLEYTRIFESYTKMIESFVMESLTAQLPGFAMDEFLGMLQAREGQLDGDVFELLYSLGDFAVFKDLILSYKPENQLDFSAGLTVTPVTGDDAMAVSPARAGGALGVGGGASLA